MHIRLIGRVLPGQPGSCERDANRRQHQTRKCLGECPSIHTDSRIANCVDGSVRFAQPLLDIVDSFVELPVRVVDRLAPSSALGTCVCSKVVDPLAKV
ncbi:MAG: hypothetical protein R8G01_08890 [Ilumatobacteraceae bacterium]|nr:hypothetical protein [Ilumatobacteraceae bacterium]